MTTNNDWTGPLNLAYEIEGLLMLLINRGDEANPEMKNLLIAKASKLLADLTMADVTLSVHVPHSDAAADSVQSRGEAPVVELPEVEFTKFERIVAEASRTATQTAGIPPAAPAVTSPAPAADAVEAPVSPAPAAPAPEVTVAPSVASVAPETDRAEVETDDEAIADNALAEERGDADVTVQTVNDTLADDSQITLDEKLARERAADISKAFTLNDRFRFRRELFRNSDEEFKETLEVIGSMSSMEEAEDYFFNDLCWDPSSPEVKEFMAIVAKHF